MQVVGSAAEVNAQVAVIGVLPVAATAIIAALIAAPDTASSKLLEVHYVAIQVAFAAD